MMNKKTEENINQLQMLEQNMQNFGMQKQNFQAQILEVDNALKELSTAKPPMFKIVGGIMVASEKEVLEKDLTSKKELLELRMKSITKQEDALKDKIKELQKSVMEVMKNEK